MSLVDSVTLIQFGKLHNSGRKKEHLICERQLLQTRKAHINDDNRIYTGPLDFTDPSEQYRRMTIVRSFTASAETITEPQHVTVAKIYVH